MKKLKLEDIAILIFIANGQKKAECPTKTLKGVLFPSLRLMSMGLLTKDKKGKAIPSKEGRKALSEMQNILKISKTRIYGKV